MAQIHINGVPFEREDATELARRLQRASAGASRAGLSPAHALAVEIDGFLEAGRDVQIAKEARAITFAVLTEWYPTAPESAKRVRRLLGD